MTKQQKIKFAIIGGAVILAAAGAAYVWKINKRERTEKDNAEKLSEVAVNPYL